eukprot:SAG11_NODE_5085_length_1668_cov_2.444232_3_plen_141_part_00
MAKRWVFFNGKALPALLRFEQDFAKWKEMESGKMSAEDVEHHVPAFARVKETLADMLGKDAPAQMEEEDERGGQKDQERDDCVPLAGVPLIPRLDAEEEAQEEARAEMTSSEAVALLDVDAEAIVEAAGEDALAIVSAGH